MLNNRFQEWQYASNNSQVGGDSNIYMGKKFLKTSPHSLKNHLIVHEGHHKQPEFA